MGRLKFFILIFCLALSIPLGYLVLTTNTSLDREERAEMQFFADALFDRMARELANLVRTEEARAVDEYHYTYVPASTGADQSSPEPSPLSSLPASSFILGYFQNNPDGSFRTPLAEDPESTAPDRRLLIRELKEVNTLFNRKRLSGLEPLEYTVKEEPPDQPAEPAAQRFEEKYLTSKSKSRASRLGQETRRVENITIEQALNLARQDRRSPVEKSVPPEAFMDDAALSGETDSDGLFQPEKKQTAASSPRPVTMDPHEGEPDSMPVKTFQAEIDPMQSVFIDPQRVFVFRRIVIDNQVFRQGLVLRLRPFLDHLIQSHFSDQPMARFSQLQLGVTGDPSEAVSVRAGRPSHSAGFETERTFPRPFSFIRATLTCERIPRSAGRRTLMMMLALLGTVILVGLFAIYQSARVVVEHSNRRSEFVSSVTHELKTPLTNIRLYIEMLEQGIARNPEREQEYYGILNRETGRLSRLIQNVLDFARLENRRRPMNLRSGNLDDVIDNVRSLLMEKLHREGFTLSVNREPGQLCRYDREAMIQILINLIENSIKFGRQCPVKNLTLSLRPAGKWLQVSLSDTGPGIPRAALKKIFNDFYRVDGGLTRRTQGTGIGLALVKKLTFAMGGRVSAEANTDGPGCTVNVFLPLAEPRETTNG